MTIKVEPGLYVICDPSYVLSDDNYEKLIEPNSISDNGYDLSIHKEGKTLICKSLCTANGDGLYEVKRRGYDTTAILLSEIVNLPVDSGMIAITSLELVEKLDLKDELMDPECCLIYIEVLELSSVYKIDGDLYFANFIVETDSIDDEDEDNWWDGVDFNEYDDEF